MIPSAPLPAEQLRLDDIARSLSNSSDLKDVKAIRDKAEAARHYAQSASLGLKIQNRAAELKLRAERRAGQLLAELIDRGGDRKSKSRHEKLKLSDLGVDHNQSARWQKEAAVPERIFEEYVVAANKMGRDITAQGLLRIGRIWSTKQAVSASSNGNVASKTRRRGKNGVCRRPQAELGNPSAGSLLESLAELRNHHGLLWSILSPYCRGDSIALKPSERRVVERLLNDSRDLIIQVEELAGCRTNESAPTG
jgi:hypothetical protein